MRLGALRVFSKQGAVHPARRSCPRGVVADIQMGSLVFFVGLFRELVSEFGVKLCRGRAHLLSQRN